MGSNLRFNYFEIAAVIIFGIGFTMLFLNRNLVKKIIGFNFMDSGVFLFLASGGYIGGRISPPERIVPGMPSGIMLSIPLAPV